MKVNNHIASLRFLTGNLNSTSVSFAPKFKKNPESNEGIADSSCPGIGQEGKEKQVRATLQRDPRPEQAYLPSHKFTAGEQVKPQRGSGVWMKLPGLSLKFQVCFWFYTNFLIQT